MIALFYGLQMIVLTLLSYEDLRTNHVSLVMLLFFVALTFLGFPFVGHGLDFPMTLGILGSIIALKLGFFLGTGRVLIGNGDLILLFPLFLSLEREEFSLFLLLSGLGGILTGFFSSGKAVPFVPALSLAYGILLLLRFL